MHRAHLTLLSAIVISCLPAARAANVIWGDGLATAGVLDADFLGLSPSYTYVNVNNQGYDVVVTTIGLATRGQGTFNPTNPPGLLDTTPALTRTFYFSAPQAQNGKITDSSFATVEFHFYETATTNPFSLTGLDFRLEDIDIGERVRQFSYFTAQGTKVDFTGGIAGSADPFLSYGTGSANVYETYPSFDTGAPKEGGSQHGKWIRVNTGATALSGFRFQIAREFNNVEGPEMTGLGNLTPGFQEIGGGAQIAAGHSYDGLTTSQGSNQGTVARLLGGSASTVTEVDAAFTPLGNFSLSDPLFSDVLALSGTGTDKFVLELSYDPSLLPPGPPVFDETTLYLAWYNPISMTFVNAVYGNTGPSTPLFAGDGAYDPTTDFNLGTYGVDTVNNKVWAVINHNSEFAAAPEPGSTLLAAFGGLALLARRRRSPRGA